MASPLIFAYIRTLAPRPSLKSSTNRFYIPVLNIPSADLRLRPEFHALFPHADLRPSDLITLDDLYSSSDSSHTWIPENASWILVDHNVLQGALGERYGSRIVGVIDHHDDEHVIPEETGDEPRIVEKSGSCASLVTNYCRDDWDQLSRMHTLSSQEGVTASQDDAGQVFDVQLAKLALASILIDTANLRSKAKVTQHDLRAVDYLEGVITRSPQSAASYSRDDLFNEIRQAKLNIESFDLSDILRKDYKEWTQRGQKRLGISSVGKSLLWQIKHAESSKETSTSQAQRNTAFLDSVRAHAERRNLSIFAIMTNFANPPEKSRRELFVWVLDPECIGALKQIYDAGRAELGLETWEDEILVIPNEDPGRLVVWRQKEVGKSRKQVAPLLRRCMEMA